MIFLSNLMKQIQLKDKDELSLSIIKGYYSFKKNN